MSFFNFPHRRFNPLLDEWVLVSPHRTMRPWNGAEEKNPQIQKRPTHDKGCYLCAGNTRANGEINPDYQDTFVFPNDFAALMPDNPFSEGQNNDPLFQTMPTSGVCKVICFSPRHDLTMAELSVEEIVKVIHTWQKEYAALSEKYDVVQIFENKGEIMGCSNPHPHGQIWASNFVPTLIEKEDHAQKKYFGKYGKKLLQDYAEKELALEERLVCDNEHFMVVVPFFAVWPFETLLLPKFNLPNLLALETETMLSLAQILKTLTQIYDKLFNCSFPYSMGWHGAFSSDAESYTQLHAHFCPPLLRSATVKKFMVGYELLAESQRDITPEIAASRLRTLL